MSELLRTENLKITFPAAETDFNAVNDISFSLAKGEILGLAGESGSGKSLTALSILRLLPAAAKMSAVTLSLYPDSPAEINLAGSAPAAASEVRGRKAGMIFQEPMTSLNPVMRCGEQVAEVLRRHTDLTEKEIKTEVLRLFEQVRLPAPERIFSAYPHQLSGGQKQRVMIAVAIAAKPDILLADEPTTALDATVRDSVIELIADLQTETGMSVIFISHDLRLLERLTDRVMVMYRGRIVEQGTNEEIFRNPQHPYTKALLTSRPPLDVQLRRLPETSDFMQVEEGKSRDEFRITAKAQNPQLFLQSLIKSEEEINARQNELASRPNLLEVNNLTVRFPKKTTFFGAVGEYLTAVNNVSFAVRKGETLGLIGESGSGKTTLGRAVLQLTQYEKGEVIFAGKNLTKLSRADMRKMRKEMQIIFQDPYASLNPRLPVGKALTEVMQLHNLHQNNRNRIEQAKILMEKTGLKVADFYKLPHEFSGGQRQRICIARALAAEPRFMVCDESVSALDVSVQAQILNLLNDLKAEFDLTYIFISHDPAVIRFISDRTGVMENGKLLL